MRDRRQEEDRRRGGEEGGERGGKDERRRRAKGTRSGRARRNLAGGTMAENCWAKSTRDKRESRGGGGREGFKIADLHKTRGYPRPLFSPSRTEEDVRRCRDAPKGRPRCERIMGQKCPHEEQIAVAFNVTEMFKVERKYALLTRRHF